MIKHLLLMAGIAMFPLACAGEDEDTEEAVEMPGEEGEDFSADTEEPSFPEVASDEGSSLSDLAGAGDAAATAAAASIENAGVESSGVENTGNGQSQYVRCAVLRIRSGPGMDHGTVGYLTFNSEVTPVSNDDVWVKIGENKYIGRHFLSDGVNERQYIPAH